MRPLDFDSRTRSRNFCSPPAAGKTTVWSAAYRRKVVLREDGQRIMAMAQWSLDAGESYFKAMAVDGWEFRQLDTGHWPMLPC